MSLHDKLLNFVADPYSPLVNFTLAQEYESIGQTAAATGLYIRTAEFGADDLLSYEAMLRVSLCIQRQNGRHWTVTGTLLRAIALMPDRPEAYFLLSREYEIERNWAESVAWAKVGDKLFAGTDGCFPPLRTDVEYPGAYGFTFEQSVSLWWMGLHAECLDLVKKLARMPGLQDRYVNATRNNMKLWNTWRDPLTYNRAFHPRLRCKFDGSETIKENYSQLCQDMFVLMCLNGKRAGRFLDIGSGHPVFGSNTFLLEKQFGWYGRRIDCDEKGSTDHDLPSEQERTSPLMLDDATKLDYGFLEYSDYDYLSLDIEPPAATLQVLKRIPFHLHRFAVITFEHDFYNGEDPTVRDESRRFLKSLGYRLVVSNVAADRFYAMEDWWVHPALVDARTIALLESVKDEPQQADMYLYGLT